MAFHKIDWLIPQAVNDNEFIGTIVDIADPNCDNRARVCIPFLHAGVPTEALPWFRNGNISGNTGVASEVHTPVLNSKVKVTFENGDFYNGTFRSALKSTNDFDSEFMSDYGTFDGRKDQWGNYYKTYSNGNFLYVSNQGVTLSLEGTVLTISGLTNTVINSEEVTLNATTVNCTNDLNVANNLNVGGDSAISGNNYVQGVNINPSHVHTNGNGGANTGGVVG